MKGSVSVPLRSPLSSRRSLIIVIRKFFREADLTTQSVWLLLERSFLREREESPALLGWSWENTGLMAVLRVDVSPTGRKVQWQDSGPGGGKRYCQRARGRAVTGVSLTGTLDGTSEGTGAALCVMLVMRARVRDTWSWVFSQDSRHVDPGSGPRVPVPALSYVPVRGPPKLPHWGHQIPQGPTFSTTETCFPSPGLSWKRQNWCTPSCAISQILPRPGVSIKVS